MAMRWAAQHLRQLLPWFPLPTLSAVVDLCLKPSLLPFTRFFLGLVARMWCHRAWAAVRRRADSRGSAAGEPPSCVPVHFERVFPAAELPDTQDAARYGCYRIPSLLALGDPFQHVLLAFCEGRDVVLDWGRIDVVLRRSEDGGKTWSALSVVASGDSIGLPGATVGNPCACWDAGRKRVVLLITATERGAAEPAVWCGVAPPRRPYVTFSDDGGLTWQQPRDISAEAAVPGGTWYATGPGRALQLTSGPHAGRLIAPCDHVRTDTVPFLVLARRLRFALHSHLLLSDDGGLTWRVGGVGPEDTNECQAAELADGVLLLSMRDFSGRGQRRHARSFDGGETLHESEAAGVLLTEPRPAGCQACIHSMPTGGIVFFTNPAARDSRSDMVLRVSRDSAASWPSAVLVRAGAAAYSCLELLRDRKAAAVDQVAILFECSRESASPYEQILLARIALPDILKDEVEARP